MNILVKFDKDFKHLEYAEYFRLLGFIVCVEDEKVKRKDFLMYCDLSVSPVEFLKTYYGIDTSDLYTVFEKYKNLFILYHYSDIRKEFLEVVTDLELLKESKYLKYACLYCKYLSQQYRVEDLADEGLMLLTSYPEFSNIWVLIGLIFSETNTRNTLDAYQNALNSMKNKTYASGTYFLYGKKCEQIDGLEEVKNNAFTKADAYYKNYRSEYKLALGYLKKETIKKAREYFCVSLSLLENHLNSLTPREQEYYFYDLSNLSYVSILENDYEKAIHYAQMALDFRDEIYEDKMKFYRVFYSDAKERKEAIMYLVKKLSSTSLYRYLGIAYQKLGLEKKALAYFEIVRKLENC